MFKPLSYFSEYCGDSKQAGYIQRYVEKLGCESIYIEERYTDKDYIVDYQKFYSRSFEQVPNTTVRIFFFMKGISYESLLSQMIPDGDINDYCLGFTTIKPVRDKNGDNIIGRTVLRDYGQTDGRKFIESPQHAHFAGRTLCFHSSPFKSQDVAVGACATAALWTVLKSLRNRFDAPQLSLYEVTEMANHSTPHGRMFPSGGLTMGQMCSFLHEAGLEVDVMKMDEMDVDIAKEFLKTVLIAFLSADIPLIAGIKLVQYDKIEHHHAVVVTGYREQNGDISNLYVHDDQIGPYASIRSKDGFRTWEYMKGDIWSEKYASIELEFLLIPLYHKIRLSFTEIWGYKLSSEKVGISPRSIRLMTSNSYKSELRMRYLENRMDLERRLPRFIWVFSFEGRVDAVIDATSPTLDVVCYVRYGAHNVL